jgi:lysophospholipase L1-like esterase
MVADSVFNSSSAMKANVSGMLWGKPFHTDEWGYRKQKKSVNKNKKSWLVIGDSVTEGVGVEDSSTFCSLLAEKMDSVNICNESFIGWSVNDYWNVVQAKVDSNTAAKLSKVTLFLCLNDIYGATKTSALPTMGTKPFLSAIKKIMVPTSC